jgi:hypothetical protein
MIWPRGTASISPQHAFQLCRSVFTRARGDLIEEYGRHTGYAELIREAVDGLVG